MSINQNLKEELSNFLSEKINSNRVKAEITSTYKLSREEIEIIKKSFPEIANFQIENKVDKSIIGGFIIKYGSLVIDLSLSTRLNSFKKIFYEVI